MERTFDERRAILVNLLQRTRDELRAGMFRGDDEKKLEGFRDSHLAVSRLYRQVIQYDYPNREFWSGVAISNGNPRHLSYSWDVAEDRESPRRKRSSVATFLSLANRRGLTNYTPEEINLIAQAVGQYFPDTLNYQFEVVTGERICESYYEGTDGKHGFGSCMRYWGCQPYVRWYAENPDKVSLVRITLGNEYVGRALLWTTDGGKKLLDRVYPDDNGPHIAAMHHYAHKQGWGECYGRDTSETVTMKRPSSGRYPYLDSFRFTNDCPSGSDTISLNTQDGNVHFNSVDGGYSGDNDSGEEEYEYQCAACGEGLCDDETHYSEITDQSYCEPCYDERFTFVQYRLESTGERVETEARHRDVTRCPSCREDRLDEHIDSEWDMCLDCVMDNTSACDLCDSVLLNTELTDVRGTSCCAECKHHLKQCAECKDQLLPAEERESGLCAFCSGYVPEHQQTLGIEETNDKPTCVTDHTGGDTANGQEDEGQAIDWDAIRAENRTLYPWLPCVNPNPLAAAAGDLAAERILTSV